jgi:hypothetical protein
MHACIHIYVPMNTCKLELHNRMIMERILFVQQIERERPHEHRLLGIPSFSSPFRERLNRLAPIVSQRQLRTASRARVRQLQCREESRESTASRRIQCPRRHRHEQRAAAGIRRAPASY